MAYSEVIFTKSHFERKKIQETLQITRFTLVAGAGVASNVILTVSFASCLLELQATITSAPQTSRAPHLVSEKMPLKNVAAVGMRCLWTDISSVDISDTPPLGLVAVAVLESCAASAA